MFPIARMGAPTAPLTGSTARRDFTRIPRALAQDMARLCCERSAKARWEACGCVASYERHDEVCEYVLLAAVRAPKAAGASVATVERPGEPREQ